MPWQTINTENPKDIFSTGECDDCGIAAISFGKEEPLGSPFMCKHCKDVASGKRKEWCVCHSGGTPMPVKAKRKDRK